MALTQATSANMQRAHRILAGHGLGDVYYCRTDTKGQGDCFFHAIVDQLSNRQIRQSLGPLAREAPLNANAIRHAVVNFAMQNKDHFLQDETVLNMLQSDEDDVGGNRDPSTIWDDYMRAMRLQGTWATELIVKIAAIFFGKDILSITATYQAIWHGGNQSQPPQFVIVNIGQWHFQSVHRRPRLAPALQQARANRSTPIQTKSSLPKAQMPPTPTSIGVPSPAQTSKQANPPSKPKATTSPARCTSPAKRARSPPDITNEPCRSCGKSFRSVRGHLAKNSECLAAYDKSEMTASNKAKPITDPNAEQAKDILDMPCRNCGIIFKTLMKHLGKKPDCKAAYNRTELDQARQNRILAAKREHHAQNRPARLASMKEHHAQNKLTRSASKKENHAQNRPARLASMKEHHAQNRQARVASMKARYRFQRAATFSDRNAEERFRLFQEDIKDGWSFACVCCHRLFFKKGVREAAPNCVREAALKSECASREMQLKELRASINHEKEGLFENSIDRNAALTVAGLAYQGVIWLCLTCNKHLLAGKRPNISSMNGLKAEPIPAGLDLNDLETCLIAKKILFMKLHHLPRGGMNAVKDKTVNIPILDDDILKSLNSIQSLPRLHVRM